MSTPPSESASSRLVTGTVEYGPADFFGSPRTCRRCGARRESGWWAPMYRPGGDRSLGDACADCHSLPS